MNPITSSELVYHIRFLSYPYLKVAKTRLSAIFRLPSKQVGFWFSKLVVVSERATLLLQYVPRIFFSGDIAHENKRNLILEE